MKTALWDDLHVSRGKAEQLEAKLRRQTIEDEVSEAWEERMFNNAASDMLHRVQHHALTTQISATLTASFLCLPGVSSTSSFV